MQGTILTYHPETNNGLISGNDGKRYNFTKADWASHDQEPSPNLFVDFETEEKEAKEVIVLEKQYSAEKKSKAVTILLCMFLGWMGAHKFYLGNTAAGVIYLIFFWTFVPYLIAVIEMWIIIFMKDKDFDRKYNSAL